MKFLYVPWRSKYVKKVREQEKKSCVFCFQANENDDQKNFILGRYKYNFVILNLHPYNTGHVMVIPFRHVKTLDELNKNEREELIELSNACTKILQEQMQAQGFNIGVNQGEAAGAGIPDHFHLHVVPRWLGDTNFLPIIAQTKTISFDLNEIYQNLRPYFAAIKF